MAKYIICISYIFFSISGLTLMKLASVRTAGKSLAVPVIGITVSALSLCGMACYAISFFLYLGVISSFRLSIVIPVLGGVVNIIILIVSYVILKEEMTVHTAVGAVIVIVGIVIMNLKTG